MSLELQFDPSQEHQRIAVDSTIDIFKNIANILDDDEFTKDIEENENQVINQEIVKNQFWLPRVDLISENLRKIQMRNDIKTQSNEQIIENGLNFTIEMETGTGKTYTYIKTIFELHKTYNWKKFIIVVPSIAILEGVLKNLEITKNHFLDLYEKPQFEFRRYKRENISELKLFASSSAIQVLVINIDSFTSDTNKINQEREQGYTPIDYLKATKPIVILDEPQNMETEIRKNAIKSLNAAFVLRYSATHTNYYNLIYSLNPVSAYNLGLVKQIEVDGIVTEDNFNTAYIKFIKITRGKNTLRVTLEILSNEKNGVTLKKINVSDGANLYFLSGSRDVYQNNYFLEEIDFSNSFIKFSNGVLIKEGQTVGGMSDDIVRFQIERTIKHHFDKMLYLNNKGIKVITLFFLDKVSNYREFDENGDAINGKYAKWFEELFVKIKNNNRLYSGLISADIDKIHNGYFAIDKQKRGSESKEIWVDSNEKNNKKDNDTYNLIMKDKERLLDVNEPLQFIFSHSALREGWDNPNVFQICTLNETQSTLKKRQEIGRGLRLPVNKFGERIFDKKINKLTVIVNESYRDFANDLQKEIQEESSVTFDTSNITDANAKKEKMILNKKELSIEFFPEFFDIWDKIKNKTKYFVNYDQEELIKKSLNYLSDESLFPYIRTPYITAQLANIEMNQDGIEGKLKSTNRKLISKQLYEIPDIFKYVKSKVLVTKSVVSELITRQNGFEQLFTNPQLYLDRIVTALNEIQTQLIVDGIKYQKINNDFYEMSLFDLEELEHYLEDLYEVQNKDKTLYNYIKVDSQVESNFAKDCELDENVKFFFKLPSGFKIPTPLGSYNPDWAVLFQQDKKIYFVSETKGTKILSQLRQSEINKIKCGFKHFENFKKDGVIYTLAETQSDLYDHISD